MSVPPPVDEVKLVDLDVLNGEFNKFHKRMIDLAKENLYLSKLVDQLNHCLQQSTEKELALCAEVKTLQNILQTAQRSLTEQCNMEDENVRLRKQLEDTKHCAEEMKENYELKFLELQKEMETQQLMHVADTARLEELLTSQFRTSTEAQKKITEDLKSQNERLIRQMKHTDEERQAEMIKLKLEYDGMLMKLQKQAAAAVEAPSRMSSVSQDIFRKKLQHIQLESKREIAGLKETIAGLQQSLSAAQDQLSRGQSNNFSKRPKKF